MIRVAETMVGIASRGVAFLGKQQHDWKVTVIRTSLSRLAYQMVCPYQSVYTIALGASATQLVIVNPSTGTRLAWRVCGVIPEPGLGDQMHLSVDNACP
jgi:hypothetical protein